MAGPNDPKRAPRKGGGGTLLWLVGAAMLGVGVVCGWYARDFFAVNACLDAGGSWTNPGVCIGALTPLR